jgi:photosystem II stability/assembly factor-like uncharacterized protein
MVAQALAVALVALVVGDGRHLALTRDGRLWRESSPPHIGPIDDAMFIDARHGWAVSEDCTAGRGIVARTVDGGQTWRRAPFGAHSCSAGSNFALDFVDARHGWIVQRDATRGVRLWRTNDGGRTWQFLLDRVFGSGVRFRTAREGWLGGYNGLYRSRHSGRQWLRIRGFGRGYGAFAAPSFFGSEAVTAAVTDDTVAAFFTADGGRQWRRRLLVPLPGGPVTFDPVRLSAPREDICWLTIRERRSLLYVSTDGGRSWARRPPLPTDAGTLEAIDGRAAVLPVYRAKRWVVLVTHDGGRTWRPR